MSNTPAEVRAIRRSGEIVAERAASRHVAVSILTFLTLAALFFVLAFAAPVMASAGGEAARLKATGMATDDLDVDDDVDATASVSMSGSAGTASASGSVSGTAGTDSASGSISGNTGSGPGGAGTASGSGNTASASGSASGNSASASGVSGTA